MGQRVSEKVNYTKVLFVINPKSGKREESNLTHLIANQAKKSGFEFQLYIMTGKDDQANISQVIAEYNPEVVAAAGGDGTVNLMAIILGETNIPLLIIPYGSANGMAKELGIANIDTAISLLETGKEKPIDLI